MTDCDLCMEPFKRGINPPYTCVPCGHVACDPCLKQWRKSKNTCPKCRKKITD